MPIFVLSCRNWRCRGILEEQGLKKGCWFKLIYTIYYTRDGNKDVAWWMTCFYFLFFCTPLGKMGIWSTALDKMRRSKTSVSSNHPFIRNISQLWRILEGTEVKCWVHFRLTGLWIYPWFINWSSNTTENTTIKLFPQLSFKMFEVFKSNLILVWGEVMMNRECWIIRQVVFSRIDFSEQPCS